MHTVRTHFVLIASSSCIRDHPSAVTTQTVSAVGNVAAAHDLGLRMYTIELPNLSSDAAPLDADDKFYGLELYAAQDSDGNAALGTVITFDSDT